MSKPTLYRNRLIPLESILLTNDESYITMIKKSLHSGRRSIQSLILHTAIHVTF